MRVEIIYKPVSVRDHEKIRNIKTFDGVTEIEFDWDKGNLCLKLFNAFYSVGFLRVEDSMEKIHISKYESNN